MERSAALYLRKSRSDPDAESIEETLARHETTLLELAKKLDLNITGIYKEIVTGDGLFTRPKMVQLLQDVDADKYTSVVCMEIDRLGRASQKDSGIIYETLQEHNVKIITPYKTYDLTNEFDEQSVELQSFIARQELRSIRRRLRKGIERTVEDGYFVAEPPYGYRRAYIDKRPTLEICDEEANVIRMVFDMYVNQGMGSHTIAEKLNSLGYSPRKADKFGRTTIQFYLQNPTYIGKVVWNRTHLKKKKTLTDPHTYIPNPKNEWIVADGAHPAIIDAELFDKAQKIRAQHSHPPSFFGVIKNPFCGILFCKNCGAPMQRQFSRISGNRLLCTTKSCNRSIKTEFVEKRILDILKQTLKDAELTDVKQLDDNTPVIIKNAIANIKREIAKLNKQKSALHDLLEQGVYDVNTFLERSNIISDKIQSLEDKLNTQYKELSDYNPLKPISAAIPTIKHLVFEYDTLSAVEKNTLFKNLFKRITYQRTAEHTKNDFSIEIQWNYML